MLARALLAPATAVVIPVEGRRRGGRSPRPLPLREPRHRPAPRRGRPRQPWRLCVMMSSTTITAPPDGLRPTARNAPRRLSCLAWAVRPAWSSTGRTARSTGCRAAAIPARRSDLRHSRATRSSGSWPRSRTRAAAEGTGTRRTPSAGRPAPPVSTPRQLSASARPSGRASARRPSSLCASRAALATPSYAVTAYTGGRPGGTGVGMARDGSTSRRLPQRAQRAGPARAQPTHCPPSRRSTDAATYGWWFVIVRAWPRLGR